MSVRTSRSLRKQLELKQKELELILAIDYIRDTTPEPTQMMTALVSILADHLRTELCLICLDDRETGELMLKAVNDKRGQFGELKPETLHELDTKTANTDKFFLWEDDNIPPSLKSLFPLDSLHVAVIPIFLKGERLGVMLFARTGTSFDPDDVELIKIAESQVDSAVIQAHEYYTLQQRNKELETIYQIDNIRDQHLPFDDMVNAVLGELRNVIQAEAGFIMLYDQSERLLKLRAATDEDLFLIAPHHVEVKRIVTESLRQGKMICYNNLSTELRSIMCLPLILNDEIIGVLGVINRYGHRGFDSEDRRLLSAIASQMDTAIFESIEQRRLRQVLGRSVDPRVMERLLRASETDILNCERSMLSVLYADIRGSTALAEHTEPDLLVGFINDYLGRMTDIILSYEGTLDKFVGDEVMALFGAPLPQPDHALRAVRVAVEMQLAHQKVMSTWEARGVEQAPIGIGIATGELVVGEFGCPKRTDYTVIGRAANLGSRICGVAKGGQILISQTTYNLVKYDVEAVPITGLHLKGVAHDVTVYQIIRIVSDEPKNG